MANPTSTMEIVRCLAAEWDKEMSVPGEELNSDKEQCSDAERYTYGTGAERRKQHQKIESRAVYCSDCIIALTWTMIWSICIPGRCKARCRLRSIRKQ
jgi:hypothetical protein